MERGGKVHDHTKSGQLHQLGRNRIKTKTMMMMILPGVLDFSSDTYFYAYCMAVICIYFHLKGLSWYLFLNWDLKDEIIQLIRRITNEMRQGIIENFTIG